MGSVCKATRIASLTAVKRFIRFVGNAVTLLLLLLVVLLVVIEDVERDRRRRVAFIHGRFNNLYGVIIFFINTLKYDIILNDNNFLIDE